MVINALVVLTTEDEQVGRIGPVVADVPQRGARRGHTLTGRFLAQSLVVVITDIDERSPVATDEAYTLVEAPFVELVRSLLLVWLRLALVLFLLKSRLWSGAEKRLP